MRIAPSGLAESKWSSASADNATATVTIAADADHLWVVDTIYFSFSADPAAAALLTVTINGSTIFSHAVTKGGIGFVSFRQAQDEGLYGSAKSQAVVVTLAASGTGGTVGRITVKYR